MPNTSRASAPDGRLRFNLALQRSRLAVHLVAFLIAIGARLLGVLHVRYGPGLALMTFAVASAALTHELYRRRVDSVLDLRPFWMAADVLIVTCGVYLTGGGASPWYLWYLSNAGAAAFAGGAAGAIAVALANTACYIGVLTLMGDVRGVDHTLWLALSRMVFLYGASFFFMRGISRLQEQRSQLRELQAGENLKVEELIQLTQDLDQGTRALAEANLQIREADRVKSRFLANMSHELRTPLNSIIGFSEVLIERLPGQITPRYLKFLHNIHSSGQHLLGIINDILDLSKVEAGRMELSAEEFRLAPVVDGVLNVMHGMASKRRVTFEVEIAPELRLETDAARLKQILYNVLSNAVKFSPEGGLVTVQAQAVAGPASPDGEEHVRVSVTDRGIGIAPSDQDVIFQEFRQVDGSATRQFGGTGLGLALVKKFVEIQGGRVGLESELGRGSTFHVTLPRRAQTEPREQPPPVETAPQLRSASRVLVVEDDLAAYQSISRSLSAAGYFPIRARQGEEALEMARMLKPTAITLDLSLPGISGWDVLRAIKADASTRAIPVVIVSMLDNRELGLTLGAEDYFTKPLDRAQFIERLRELAPPGPRDTPRILLIDDDPAIHELLGDELPRLGYVVDHAHSGAEGVELATGHRPDVVALDLDMPDMTGFEVASRLKAQEGTTHVPIVVLTALDLSAEERGRLQGKMAALVQKGQSIPPRLVAAIRELESKGAREGTHGG